MRTAWNIVARAAADFVEDDAMTLGAALAYYTALAMAPLLLCLVAIAGLAGSAFETRLVEQVQDLVGPEAGRALAMILESADRSAELRSFAGLIGLATVLFAASGAFAQLQYAMNRIWQVKAKPGQGLWGWLRKRFLSAGMVLTVGFLLLVSLVLSAAISGISQSARHLLPGTDVVWRVLDIGLSFATVTFLFALLYKVLPDVRITWRDVWAGAVVTAVLFVAGKYAIGLYLGRASLSSAYGAAGSLIVLLVWVYYASLILFFGAELTQAYAEQRGHAIEPDTYAVSLRAPSLMLPEGDAMQERSEPRRAA